MKPEHPDICASLRALSTALAVALALSACVSLMPAPVEDRSRTPSDAVQSAGPGYHIVKKGDTLYSIALEYGQDYREVAAWNYLTDPNRISIGQSLRIWPPGASSATGGGAVASTAPIAGEAPVEQRVLSGSPETSPVAVPVNTASIKREPMGDKEPYSDARYEALKKAPSGAMSAPVASATQTTSTPAPSTPTPSPVPEQATPDQATSAAAGGIVWEWPADGRVVGGFSQNKGLEIAGKAGDSIRAAADGKVVYTGDSLSGYGNLVIIKHNNDYLTAYAHNRKILVKEGQSVKRGAKIAEMGSSDSNMVKLHFEVRMQGKPVEPLNYLPKK